MRLGRVASRGAGWSAIGAMSSGALQLLQLVLLARILSVDDYGLAAMTMIPIGLAGIFADAGMGNLLVVNQKLSARELASLYWLNWMACVGMLVIMVAGAPWIAVLLAEPRAENLIRLASLTFLLMPIGQQCQFLLQRELFFRQIATVELAGALAATIVAIAAAKTGYGPQSLILGTLVAALLRSLLFVVAGRRLAPPLRHFAWADIKPHLRFSGYQTGERLLNFTAWNLDKMLISVMLGSVAMGYYNMAYQLVQRPLAVLQPVLNRVALAVFAKVGTDDERLNRGYLLTVRGLALALFPLLFAVSLLKVDVVRLVLGERWMAAAPILGWLALLHCFYAIGPAIGPYLLARQRADVAFWMNVWAALLYAAAVAVGARHGAEGVAIALLIATATGLFTIGFWVRWNITRMGGMAFIAALMPGLIAATAAYGAADIFLWAIEGSIPSGTWQHLLSGLALGGAVYAGVLVLWFRPAVAEILDAADLRPRSMAGQG